VRIIKGDVEMEDDISIEIAGDEARKETKTEEPSFLRYQRDLYRPDLDMGSGGELKSLILSGALPRNPFVGDWRDPCQAWRFIFDFSFFTNHTPLSGIAARASQIALKRRLDRALH
jgi:hypothetical protein